MTVVSAPILVTGAAGFAGSHLLDLLRREGRPLVGWHHPSSTAPVHAGRSPSATAPSTPPITAADPIGPVVAPIAWQGVDLTDYESVRAAIAECRSAEVYHLAGIPHVGKSWAHTDETLRVNALGTSHLLEALRELAGTGTAGVSPARVLIIGSAAVYRPSDEAMDETFPIGPTSPYGLSKLAQELTGLQAHALHGQPVIVSRSFNHIGPGQSPEFVASSLAKQIAAIEAGQAPAVIEVGNLDPRRDLTDVRDTVRAYRLLMQRGQPGQTYNVCSGQAHAVRDILEGLLARSTVRVEVRVDPARLRPVDQPIVLGRFDRLTRDTGWRPEIAWAQTLTDLLDDWRARIAA